MSRIKRTLRKKFIVFCEGDTEYHYVNYMRLKQGVDIALKPINMKGGGYTNFLNIVKTEASNNCLAKFIIIDYDRVKKHSGEKRNLEELIEHCRCHNKNGKIPYFIIIDNPDFEYISCLHIPDYNGQNVKQYIETTLDFKDIKTFKAKEDIYNYLNSKKNSYKVMLSQLKEKIIINSYTINKTNMDIKINKTDINWANESKPGSNIDEFFDVIDW